MEQEEKKLFRPVNSGKVVDQIINSITDSIIKGVYPAGSKLPNEYELIDQLKVSRNSLREAMKILSAMGIVEIRRGDGTYVCSQMNPSIFDSVVYSMIYGQSTSDELLEFRKVIDEMTIRFAMTKITSTELAELYSNVDEMDEAIRKEDYSRSEELDWAFHNKLIESCDNVFYIRIIKGIYSIFRSSIGRNIYKEKQSSLAAVTHRKMLDCIRDHNSEAIPQTVADSLRTWGEIAK